MMRGKIAAAALVACCCLLAACAQQPPRDPNCPQSASELPIQSLYGSWEARIDGQDGLATMVLGRHPEYDGVRGSIRRPGQASFRIFEDMPPDLAFTTGRDRVPSPKIRPCEINGQN